MQIYQVKERGGPVLSQETRSEEESACLHSKLIIVHLYRTILRRTVHTGGFEGVMKIPKEEILKGNGASKFTTLVCAYATTVLMAVMLKEFRDNVQRRFLCGREEDPCISGCLINDEEVGSKAIIQPDNSSCALCGQK